MGNSPSASAPAASSRQHAAGEEKHALNRQRSNDGSGRRDREPRRRESIHTLSSAKSTAAPPSASLASATAQPTSSSTSPSQARDHIGASQSRSRSQTIPTPRIQPRDRETAEKTSMGNESSREVRPTSSPKDARSHPSNPLAIKTSHSPASQPVDVPGASQRPFDPSPLDPDAPPSEAYQLPPASYSRPPRLPLAIEEEDHTPGSPIILPADVTSPVDSNDPEDRIARRTSVISSTVDDEEEADDFQGHMPNVGPDVPKVPTIIEWRDALPTDRVYVTGTFTDWQRKFRLHHNGPSKHKNTLSATLQLPPGTHHVKFLVNDDMLCSNYLPTTVDFTNILMNYIEVSSDHLPAPGHALIPAAAPTPPPPVAPSRPLDIRPKTAESATTAQPQTPARHAPQTPTSPAPGQPGTAPVAPASQSRPSPATAPRFPPKTYTSEIPAYLADLDSWPASSGSPETSTGSASSRLQRANAAAALQPTPPSLPLFLSKSILNGTTPLKDDSSVLIMPNHTVLNHLATTNIKQGILATSATTRYKKKFLTTIMYKPRSDDSD